MKLKQSEILVKNDFITVFIVLPSNYQSSAVFNLGKMISLSIYSLCHATANNFTIAAPIYFDYLLTHVRKIEL